MMNHKLRKRARIAVFIRDVPSFGEAPIVRSLLAQLAKRDVHPVYCYSVAELLKDARNVKKMKALADNLVKGSDDALLIARGCDHLLRHLFERAIRSCPELIVIDYLSESLVDVRRLIKITQKLNYKTVFLKKGIGGHEAVIKDAVKLITSHIKHQNHAEIWCQREADKWWHEIDRIFINNEYSPKACSPYYCPHLVKMPLSKTATDSEKMSQIRCTEHINQQAEIYCQSLEEVATILSGNQDNNVVFMQATCPEQESLLSSLDVCDELCNQGPEFTLIVVDDFHFRRPGQPRLFELLVEKILQDDWTFHAVPVGQLVVTPKFQLLFDWFCSRSDMDMVDTYSYLFLDAFHALYRNEKIVILDNIHEGIVMSSYYIAEATRKNWEVIVLKRDKFWPPNDDEIIAKTIRLLKERGKEERINISNASIQNYAYGDFVRLD